jgi:hypothetical protein
MMHFALHAFVVSNRTIGGNRFRTVSKALPTTPHDTFEANDDVLIVLFVIPAGGCVGYY